MRMTNNVYQPRSSFSVFSEKMAAWRQKALAWLQIATIRGAGALLLTAVVVLTLLLASYNPRDPSPDNATGGDPTNLLGGLGATAADVLLLWFGLAVVAFLIPLFSWGWRALCLRPLSFALVRVAAWLLGTLFSAAGLGLLPRPDALPAGCGGLVGILTANYAEFLGRTTAQGWLPFVLMPLFLIVGVVLTLLGADLRIAWRRRPKVVEAAAGEPAEEEAAADIPSEIEAEEDEPVSETPVEASAPKKWASPAAPPAPAGKRARQASLNLGDGTYQLPPEDLLAEPKHDKIDAKDLAHMQAASAKKLEEVLSEFGVKGRIVDVRPGPVVTLYEFEPAAGVKSSRVIALSDDIARSMSAVAARVAGIPGRNVLGIELPNPHRETVYLREMFESDAFAGARQPLILALGKTIGGEPEMADLAKMPHLLIAGTTGSGKSVALNTMILSLLYRLPPERCRMIMIDPKMLELSVYDGIPHLLTPVVTDPKKAVVALKWAVREMEDRYQKMSKLGVRGVEAFNERVRSAKAKGERLKRTVQTGFDKENGKPIFEDQILDLDPMPYIVIVVDEMADLMMVSGKEIEGAVQRLAQMARAAGLHLITATQRPSVDVITGTIKANFPTRISFQVTSKVDSRTILGEQGAEQLLGMGDMLYMMAGGRIRRVHGPFVSDTEVDSVVNFLKTQGQPEYLDAVTEEPEDDAPGEDGGFGSGNRVSGDALYDQALDIIARDRKASTSYIQRRLQIGYNRAARLVERMEKEGVVSKPNHKGVREVLLPDHREE